MKNRVKVNYGNFKIESTFHNDAEYILESGNHKRHAIKITNTKWFNCESFDFWDDKIVTQKALLKAFQKIMFQGLAASAGPDLFCYALMLDEDSRATELRFEVYQEITKKMKNLFAAQVFSEFQMSGFAMALIARMKTEGIDCGLNLGK